MPPCISHLLVKTGRISGFSHYGCRQIHCSRQCSKNPYYFYDLQRQQVTPTNNAESASYEAVSSAPNRRVFNPLMNQPLESMEQRVSKVFGAMGSRDESRKVAQQHGVTVAGIHVPARPEEPTNCCMSGCINCVWELYKDELEEYRALRKLAREKLNVPQYDHVNWPFQLGAEPKDRLERSGKKSTIATSGSSAEPVANDDDGGDSELSEGIKVFIATEKRLHEKRQHSKGL